MKDLSSPSEYDANIYDLWLHGGKKSFSGHPGSETDGHERCFATIRAILMVTISEVIQTLTRTLKLMRFTSVFLFTLLMFA